MRIYNMPSYIRDGWFLLFIMICLSFPFLVCAQDIPCYGLFEWREPVQGTYKNPFDLDEVDFSAKFTRPDGVTVVVPGFYFQDFEPVENSRLREKGEPQWVVRFSPSQPGTYSFITELKTKEGIKASQPKEFKAIASDKLGFIRDDLVNRLFFRTDSGKPYFPIGVSLAWTSRENLLGDYKTYLDKLAANGCNFTRVWTCEWNLPLEWTDNPSTQGIALGLGRYSQDNSWRLDRLLEMAEKRDIRVLLTLGTYGELMTQKGPWGEQSWDRNPYNSANGGPCHSPDDFFSNDQARRLYQQRLRYIAARWGYCTHLFALELWNEVKAPPDWVKIMGDYLGKVDPNKHLVANSVAFPWDRPYDEGNLWKLPEMAYSQSHYYGAGSGEGDMAEYVYHQSALMAVKYSKPFFFEELGLDASKDDAKIDSQGQGTHLHNAIWASLVGLSAGAPLSHWKEYIDTKNLYGIFASARPFADAVDRGIRPWETLEQDVPLDDGASEDLVLRGTGQWGDGGGELISVSNTGDIAGTLNRYLRTTARDGYAPVLKVDLPEGCQMGLGVDQVSVGADVTVSVDGKEVWHHIFDASPPPGGDGEYRHTAFNQQYNIYVGDYQKDYFFALPAGKHEIKIDNNGSDWVSLTGITLTHYLRGSRIKLYGIRSKDEVVAWIQDKKDVWSRVYRMEAQPPVERKGVVFNLSGLDLGYYQAQWWDTYSGKVILEQVLKVEEGPFFLTVPAFKRDIAVILRRQPGV